MRFMVMLNMPEDAGPPPPELPAAMGAEMESLFKSGVMVDAGGLLPSAAGGARVRLANGTVTVTDGPFTEATELIGGYSIVQVASRDEALALATRLIEIHKEYWPGWEGTAEMRQMHDDGLPPEATG